MLVLGRQENEKVVIGEGENQVVMTITKIGRENVRVGFEAPKDIPIIRAEVLERNKGKAA